MGQSCEDIAFDWIVYLCCYLVRSHCRWLLEVEKVVVGEGEGEGGAAVVVVVVVVGGGSKSLDQGHPVPLDYFGFEEIFFKEIILFYFLKISFF